MAIADSQQPLLPPTLCNSADSALAIARKKHTVEVRVALGSHRQAQQGQQRPTRPALDAPPRCATATSPWHAAQPCKSRFDIKSGGGGEWISRAHALILPSLASSNARKQTAKTQLTLERMQNTILGAHCKRSSLVPRQQLDSPVIKSLHKIG